MSRSTTPPDAPIGYVLKGYPRISELFIASEIYRLEQLGLPLQIYVLKPADESTRHPVVDQISARVEYAPATDSLSRSGLPSWLYRNGGAFVAPVLRLALRHPVRVLRTVTEAARQSWRARRGGRPRTIYVKEFLQAGWLADTILRSGGVRRLHAHFAHGTTTVTWLAASLLDVPFSFTGHAKDIYLESLNPAGLLARKMNAATAVVTCTGANVDHLRSLVPEVPVHLAYHGLNAEFSALIAEAPPATPPSRARLVSVGRLVRKKGFDVLLEAFAIARSEVDCRLVILGEGPERATLLAQAERLGLAYDIDMPGFCANPFALMARAGAFVLSSRWEGFPNALVEAMACGAPVIATDCPSGPHEILDGGKIAPLVPVDDADALGQALLASLSSPPDTARAQARAQMFSVSAAADQYLAALEQR